MKTKYLRLGAIALGLVAVGGYFLVKTVSKPEAEEVIVYENKVVETIDPQLKDLSLDKIREKGSLIMEKSIEEIQSSISKGDLTYTELTAFYLDRIKTYDKAKKGINAVMEINPNAISEAKKLDEEKSTNKTPLYGIPVLVKDNINTKDMATSAGTLALKDFKPSENAPLINKLIENKAIILGKSNLSELANFFDVLMPSGYSSKLGQTHNPFNPLVLSPSGSSSGSGAAVAANLSAVALGTETTGSIIAPANAQSIVGFKPTKDVISGEGVIPLSSTMDTVGPMTKTVKDAVALFNGAVENPENTITITSTKEDLAKKRIGVYKTDGSEKFVETLKKLGAEVVELEMDKAKLDNEFIMLHDFKIDFEAYAKKYNPPVKTLSELVKFNSEDLDRRAKYGQGLLEDAAKSESNDGEKIKKTVEEYKVYIKGIIDENKLDALAFMNNEGTPIACVPGYPEITVPFGENDNKEPIGVTFFAQAGEDEKIVNLAYAFEQGTNLRLIPEKYKEFIEK